jgi:anthraniloyl-CoA monooxygenase
MKVAVIGGGPAGLFFSILTKKAFPESHVVVFEKNERGRTYGWGVVLSNKILLTVEEADPDSFQRIEKRLLKWTTLNVIHKGEQITYGGNNFSALSRLDLLNTLWDRCEELGVEIVSNCKFDTSESLRDYDLIVGADGINSSIRDEYKHTFKPSITTAGNRYIWYGTRKEFDGLTLIFLKCGDLVFTAHAYGFSPETSTFIVEVDQNTWQKAGLDKLSDEATRALIQDYFSDYLRGYDLLSNRSHWSVFQEVRNQNWSAGNIILIGDALHTCHFTIGSGTRLALEDAICLTNSLKISSNLSDAFLNFTMERRPVIEKYQAMARSSQRFFENISTHMLLDPLPFTHALMRRSKSSEAGYLDATL